MWIDQVDFDGSTISGILLNEPYIIENVQAGETVRLQFESIVDWMFYLMALFMVRLRFKNIVRL